MQEGGRRDSVVFGYQRSVGERRTLARLKACRLRTAGLYIPYLGYEDANSSCFISALGHIETRHSLRGANT